MDALSDSRLLEFETYCSSLERTARGFELKRGSFLVTGATGLIGSYLVDALSYANEHLGCAYEICAAGRSVERLKSRFPHAARHGLRLLAQDASALLPYDAAFDCIVHLASNADPAAYASHPAETLLTCVEGAKAMLEHCRSHPSTRLVLASTFEVYGENPSGRSLVEGDASALDLSRVRSVYPAGKCAAELLARAYGDEYGIDVVIARLSSVYGPTMKPNDSKAHAQFFRRALAGEDVVLKSAGTQRRSYTYVADAASALMTLAACGACCEAYNVSNLGSTASIAEVAEAIATAASVALVHHTPTAIEAKGYSAPCDSVLDGSRLAGLGWEPRYALADGVQETLEVLRCVGDPSTQVGGE